MRKKTRDKIKFDNRTIEAIKVNDLEFTYVAKDGSVKAKRKILLPFQVPKKSITKGLKLCIHRDTGSKYFWLQFWYNGKADYYSVGKFIPGSWLYNFVFSNIHTCHAGYKCIRFNMGISIFGL